MNQTQHKVDVINEDYCYSKFYENYLKKNILCMLSKSFTDSWLCRSLWVENGKPNWKYLEDNYGLSEVPVANCDAKYFNSHPKSCWTLKDFIIYVRKYTEESCPPSMPCFYLKDWHCFKTFPDSTAVYETPIYFAVDWLNEHWILEKDDDYRFVYIGPKGSWTPFHSDVYGSFSWSANIVGKKRWVFFPPGEEELLKNVLNVPVLPQDLTQVDLSTLPIAHFDLIQEAGEIVFVPSGWYHQVWNLEDTISINHNWFNGANINFIHKALLRASDEIKAEISDYGVHNLDEDQFEIFLNSHHGMNFQQFRQILKTIIKRRELGHLKIHSVKTCSCSTDNMCNEDVHRKEDIKVALEIYDRITNANQ